MSKAKAIYDGSLLKLEPALIEYLDQKLADNFVFQNAVEKKLPRVALCEVAKAMVGFKEKTGKNDGVQINWVQETFGDAQGEPYCISGVMTCVAYVCLKTGIKHKLFETESSGQLWDKTPKAQRVKNISLPGAIAVWADLDAKGKRKWTGHGEIVLADDGNVFHCVGFNTSGTVNPNDKVNRDGNGVYYTVRKRQNTKSRMLLGFIKPF